MTSLSQDLSSGATESASAVTEISATINQMAAQIRQTSEYASEANALSRDSEHSARGGNELMVTLKAAMQEINQSGLDITNIIRAIEEIATQTNLLALNAAIEAARPVPASTTAGSRWSPMKSVSWQPAVPRPHSALPV